MNTPSIESPTRDTMLREMIEIRERAEILAGNVAGLAGAHAHTPEDLHRLAKIATDVSSACRLLAEIGPNVGNVELSKLYTAACVLVDEAVSIARGAALSA